MSKHTPGPWEVKSPANDSRAFDVYAQGGHLKMHHGHWGGEADARLIAAAPELFQALQVLLEMPALKNIPVLGTGPVDAARAAIAKVTGGKP